MKDTHKRITLTSQKIADMQALGNALGACVEPATLVVLSGELGAGKTELSGAIGKGMEIACTMTSPTFSFLKRYESDRIPLNHLDVYRLESADQLIDIGFWDLLTLTEPSAILVEWGEKFSEIVSNADLVITLSATSVDMRDVELQSLSTKGDELLSAAMSKDDL